MFTVMQGEISAMLDFMQGDTETIAAELGQDLQELWPYVSIYDGNCTCCNKIVAVHFKQ